jgi:hypothetical protein
VAKYKVGDKVYYDAVGVLARPVTIKAVYPRHWLRKQKYIIQEGKFGLYEIVTEDRLLPRQPT